MRDESYRPGGARSSIVSPTPVVAAVYASPNGIYYGKHGLQSVHVQENHRLLYGVFHGGRGNYLEAGTSSQLRSKPPAKRAHAEGRVHWGLVLCDF